MDGKNEGGVALKMSSLEIRAKEFKRTAWGFSPKEVADFLDGVSKHVEKFQKVEKELTEKVKQMSEELTRWKNKELEIMKLREKAVQEAESIREQASKEATKVFAEVEERANSIRQKTEEWLENVIAEIEETERQKTSFVNAFKAALDSHYALLQTEQAECEPLGAKLNHFLKSTMSAAGRA